MWGPKKGVLKKKKKEPEAVGSSGPQMGYPQT
jgi:hypothetical protein